MASDNQLDFSVLDGKLFKRIETRRDTHTSTLRRHVLNLCAACFEETFFANKERFATASSFADSCSTLIAMKVPLCTS